MKKIVTYIVFTFFSGLCLFTTPLLGQGTAFSYQGRLNDSGQPGNGSYDLRFTVYDSSPYSVVAVDFNGDGKPDLACANYGSDSLTVLTNNGNGTFTLAATLPVGAAATGVTAADLNGDGRVDLVSADGGSNTLSVFTNLANAAFNRHDLLQNHGQY